MPCTLLPFSSSNFVMILLKGVTFKLSGSSLGVELVGVQASSSQGLGLRLMWLVGPHPVPFQSQEPSCY